MEKRESASLATKHERKPLLSSLEDKLKIMDSLRLPIATSCYIYKVPPKLRKVNEEVYTPSLVSIGPFHHENERLQSMEDLKLWHLNNFLKRNQDKQLKDYVTSIKDWENEIRHCYSETIPIESDDFVSMILTDTCFIIEYFLTIVDPLEQNRWCFNIWPRCDINLDLILLENQVPFFVLEGLFNLTFPNGFFGKFSFVEITFNILMCQLLCFITPNKEILEKYTFSYFKQHYLERPTSSVQVQHLNHMLRILYLPLPNQLPERKLVGDRVKLAYNASQLHEAGIEFQVNRDKSIIELQYSKGVLKIPCLEISDVTEVMIRNVVAFEQCHLPFDSYMTDYIALLNYLIDTGKDVEILVEKGIINNLLGDNNEAASLVNNLYKNIMHMTFNGDYNSISKKLNNFYKYPCHKFKAIFMREYLSTPWKIASFIAAIVLLLLTLIQTICSVISLFNK